MAIAPYTAQTVRLATTGNINLNQEYPIVIDGVTLGLGDKVLVKDQAVASQNGVYILSKAGKATLARAKLSRPLTNELVSGGLITVQEGATNADKTFTLTTNNPITVNTTPLSFSVLQGVADLTSTVTLDTPQIISGHKTFSSSMTVDGQLELLSGGFVTADSASDDSSLIVRSSVDGDADSRFEITAGGEISWGDGSSAPDVSVEREDTGVLRVDGSIRTSVTPTDGDDLVNKDYVDTKQSSLGYTPEDVSNKDTDVTLSSNSDVKYPSQKAVKTYVDTKQPLIGYAPENAANKDTDGTLSSNSDVKYPTQKAVKTYADTKQPLLGFIPENVSNKDTDVTLAANSDTLYPSQKAVKAYADTKQSALGFIPEDSANKGVAGGYAELDNAGKVPVSQLPSSIMQYQGLWDAATNTPALADGVGDPGDVWRVSTAATKDLGSGPIEFSIGDYVIYNMYGSWERATPTDAVSSVNGYTGEVTITASDVGLGSVDNALQIKASDLDTDAAMTADSDSKVPSQKAVRAYVAANSGAGDMVLATSQTVTGKKAFAGLVDTDIKLSAKVSTDTDDRYSVQSDGKLAWGPGNSAADAVLYRSATGQLMTDTQLRVGGSLLADSDIQVSGTQISFSSSARILLQNQAAGTSEILNSQATGDSASRYSVDASGKQAFGNGTDDLDVTLERTASGTLKAAKAGAASRAAIQVDDAPIASSDLANKAYVDSVAASGGGNARTVRVADNWGSSISNPESEIFDFTNLSSGDVVLLYGQADSAENGPWVFNGVEVAMTRPSWWEDGSVADPGTLIVAREGANNYDSLYQMSTNGTVTVGTTGTDWQKIGVPGVIGSSGGTISNYSFLTLDNTAWLFQQGRLTQVTTAISGNLTTDNSTPYRQTYSGSGGHTFTLVTSATGTRDYLFDNAGTGDFTITKNVADTLMFEGKSVSSFTVSPGQAVWLYCSTGNRWNAHTLSSVTLGTEQTFTAKKSFGAGINYATTTKTGSYAVDLATDHTIFVNSPSSSQTITLPASHTNGDEVIVKDIGGNASVFPVIVATSDSDLIDGNAADYLISGDYESLTLRSNGTDWFII